MKQKDFYTINEAAEFVGKTSEYVRRAIHQGKIATRKVEIARNTFRHEIAHSDLLKWRSSAESGGSRRSDNRNKFTLYATPEELAAIEKLLKANKIASPIKRANKVKAS